MEGKLSRTLTTGLILATAFALTACAPPVNNTSKQAAASVTPEKFSRAAASIRKSTILTDRLSPLNQSTPTDLSFVPLTLAPHTQSGYVTIGNVAYQLPVRPGQSVQYAVLGHTLYWAVTGALGAQMFSSSWEAPTVGNNSAVASTSLIYTSPAEGGQPAPGLRLLEGNHAVYFTLATLDNQDKDLYLVSGTHNTRRELTFSWPNKSRLYTLSLGSVDLFALLPGSSSAEPALISVNRSGQEQNLRLPYWPLQTASINGQSYLISGPDVYRVTADGKVQASSWIPTEMQKTATTLADKFQGSSLILPSLYFQTRIVKPFQASVTISGTSSYTLALTPPADTSIYQLKVRAVGKTFAITAYNDWIHTLDTLVSSASGRTVEANTPTSSPKTTSAFFGHLPVLHQFILNSGTGPWLRWTQAQAKYGSKVWFVAWGTHGWLYQIGPLVSLTDPASQRILNQFLARSRLNSLQAVAQTGEVSVLLSWNQGVAKAQTSLYEYLPAAEIAVQLSAPGYTGWRDLANFAMTSVQSVKAHS